jgi:hypothetical protein
LLNRSSVQVDPLEASLYGREEFLNDLRGQFLEMQNELQQFPHQEVQEVLNVAFEKLNIFEIFKLFKNLLFSVLDQRKNEMIQHNSLDEQIKITEKLLKEKNLEYEKLKNGFETQDLEIKSLKKADCSTKETLEMSLIYLEEKIELIRVLTQENTKLKNELTNLDEFFGSKVTKVFNFTYTS